MEKISLTDYVGNGEVLRRVKEEKNKKRERLFRLLTSGLRTVF